MNVASQLQAINRELAAMLRTEATDLALGAETALQDDLVLCGLLGGKDVGKSTLVYQEGRPHPPLHRAWTGVYQTVARVRSAPPLQCLYACQSSQTLRRMEQ